MLTIDMLKEFGVNTEEGLQRCFGNEDFYMKLVKMIPADGNFQRLEEALASGNLTAGFEAGNPGEPPPKHAHGSSNLGRLTSSSRLISKAAMEIFDRIMNPALKVRRLGITATHVVPCDVAGFHSEAVQLDLFEDSAELERRQKEMEESLKKERALQETVLNLKKRFGKNTVLRGFNFEEGATGRDRNMQIGGHKA